MSVNYEGYGMLTDDLKYKKDADIIFMDEFLLKTDWGMDDFKTYCEDEEISEDDEAKEQFVESYENDSAGCYELEGLIVDYINVEKLHGQYLQYEDYCIHVPATLPVNEEDRKKILTQEEIQKVLSEVFDKLLEEPVEIRWYSIHVD